MKKILVVILAFSLASLACSIQKTEPTPVPTATSIPTLAAPPTDAPTPTEVPTQEPTAVPPSPTPLPPTETLAPTATSMPSATSAPTEKPLELTELFSDNFDSASGPWYIGETDTTRTRYTNGAIEFKLSQESWLMWSETARVYTSDVVVTVDSKLVAGTDMNSQGILCRYVDTDNFYALMVGNDGYYEIMKYKNGEPESLVGEFADEGVIDPLENQITASCIGDELTLKANGVHLSTITDSDLQTGDVGLIIGTFDEPDVTIQFDNFAAYAPK